MIPKKTISKTLKSPSLKTNNSFSTPCMTTKPTTKPKQTLCANDELNYPKELSDIKQNNFAPSFLHVASQVISTNHSFPEMANLAEHTAAANFFSLHESVQQSIPRTSGSATSDPAHQAVSAGF